MMTRKISNPGILSLITVALLVHREYAFGDLRYM